MVWDGRQRRSRSTREGVADEDHARHGAERIGAAERQRRWRQLADIYLAQQISNYPPDYLQHQTVDRLLETIERFEEDLTDQVRVHGHLHAIIEVGAALPVSAHRDRRAEVDPLMVEIEQRLQQMLDRLAHESPLYIPAATPGPSVSGT